jgi:hypothetical protein
MTRDSSTLTPGFFSMSMGGYSMRSEDTYDLHAGTRINHPMDSRDDSMTRSEAGQGKGPLKGLRRRIGGLLDGGAARPFAGSRQSHLDHSPYSLHHQKRLHGSGGRQRHSRLAGYPDGEEGGSPVFGRVGAVASRLLGGGRKVARGRSSGPGAHGPSDSALEGRPRFLVCAVLSVLHGATSGTEVCQVTSCDQHYAISSSRSAPMQANSKHCITDSIGAVWSLALAPSRRGRPCPCRQQCGR